MGANSRNIQYFNILFDRNVMVRSTDSDLLFVYLGVHQQFDAAGIRVIIQFNSPGAHFRKYVDCSKLVSELRNYARAYISLLGNGISVIVYYPNNYDFRRFLSKLPKIDVENDVN